VHGAEAYFSQSLTDNLCNGVSIVLVQSLFAKNIHDHLGAKIKGLAKSAEVSK
jgi:hypothetical protein